MTTQVELKIPNIGDFDEVEVIEVLVAKGDEIKSDDPILAVESDKATMEIPSSLSGKITEIHISVGDMVAEGTVVALINADTAVNNAADEVNSKNTAIEEDIPEAETVASTEPTSDETIINKQAVAEVSNRHIIDNTNDILPYASPAVRRISRELGVNLSLVKGSGHKNRITKEDVKNYVKELIASSNQQNKGFGIPTPVEIDFSQFGDIKKVELNRIKRLSGPHLHSAWLNIPHVTNHDEVDITDLEVFRKSLIPEFSKKDEKITLVAFAVLALMKTLKQFPIFNASLDPTGKQLILKDYFNIGVAVNTDKGLLVPVMRGVDRKGLVQIVTELNQLSQKARDGKLSNTDLQGGCISISSLGGLAGTSFTPIVNSPEVAILGISRALMRPVWNGTEFLPRLMLPLSLSYDHRVIDGAEAAQFLIFFKEIFKDIRRLVL